MKRNSSLFFRFFSFFFHVFFAFFTFFRFFSLNFRFTSIFSHNFCLFSLHFRFRFLVFHIEVNHVKSGFFFASKRNEIFASISNFASEAKVRAHLTAMALLYKGPVPEIIDPVFAKTSQNARFLLSENERFGLVFVKIGSINSGTEVDNRNTNAVLQMALGAMIIFARNNTT